MLPNFTAISASAPAPGVVLDATTIQYPAVSSGDYANNNFVQSSATAPLSGPEVKSYYFAGSQMIAVRTQIGGNSTLNFLHSDHLGSTSLTTDASGNPVARQLYDAWGNIRASASSGTMPTDIGYTGQRLDNSTGLMYYRARYYAQGLGRFISADTIVPDTKNPQNYNRYAYTLNNPVKYNDPTGHDVGCPGKSAGNCKPDPRKDLIDQIQSLTGARVLGQWTADELTALLNAINHMPADKRHTVEWVARLSHHPNESPVNTIFAKYWVVGESGSPFDGAGIAIYDSISNLPKLREFFGVKPNEKSLDSILPSLDINHEWWHSVIYMGENGEPTTDWMYTPVGEAYLEEYNKTTGLYQDYVAGRRKMQAYWEYPKSATEEMAVVMSMWSFRSELNVRFPVDSAPYLRVCAVLGCQ